MDAEPTIQPQKLITTETIPRPDFVSSFTNGEHLGIEVGHTIIADLPVLQANDIGPKFESSSQFPNIPFWEINLYGQNDQENISHTDWAKVQQHIDRYLSDHPEVAQQYPDYLKNPVSAALLAAKITEDSFSYYHEIAIDPSIDPDPDTAQEINRVDHLSIDNLFAEGKAICRHYSLAAAGIYECFKQSSGQALDNTYLIPITNHQYSTELDADNHVYDLFFALEKEKNYFSIVDPTHDQGRRAVEVETSLYTHSRLSALIEFLSNPNKSSLLPPELTNPETLNTIIDSELNSIETRIDFNQSDSIENALSRTGIYLNSGKDYVSVVSGLCQARETINNPDLDSESIITQAFDQTVRFVLNQAQNTPYEKDFIHELIRSASITSSFNPQTMLKLIDQYQSLPSNNNRQQQRLMKQTFLSLKHYIHANHNTGFLSTYTPMEPEYQPLYQRLVSITDKKHK